MRSRPPTGKSEKVQGFVQPTTALEHSKPEPFSHAHDVSGWNRNAGIGEEDDLEGVVRRGDRAFESHLLQRGIRCKLLWLGLNVLPHRPDRVQAPGGVFQVREDEDALGSRALRADAMESIACGWLSLAVVIGLMAQLMLGAWWVDSVTSLVLVWLLIKEGREAWKAEDDED